MANSVLAKMAVEISANTAKFNQGLAQAANQTKSFERRLDGITNSIKGAGLGIVAGLGASEIISNILRVTSEFEKLEAVLTNTLGDNSRAKSALDNIRDFAVKTPFEVSELSASYIRWTNQGLNPTISSLQKIGDVASSLGAGFDQTAEAFKDLAVGQTKRLEEIGIAAQQSNGKIQLSFKGVNLEIEKNADGVKKALDVYSQLPGVIGSTEAVSKTLGGSLSNLNDAWENFLLTLGSSSNLFSGVTKSLTNILIAFANFDSEIDITITKLRQFAENNWWIVPISAPANIAKLFAGAAEYSKETYEYALKLGTTQTGQSIAGIISEIEKSGGKTRTTTDILEERSELEKLFTDALTKEGEKIEDINAMWKIYIENVNKRYQEEYQNEAEIRKQQAQRAKNEAIRIKEEQKLEREEKAKTEAARKASEMAKKQQQISDLKALYEQAGLLDLLNTKATEISKKSIFKTDELDILQDAAKEIDKLYEKWVDFSGITPNQSIINLADPFVKASEQLQKIKQQTEEFESKKEIFQAAFPEFKPENITKGFETYIEGAKKIVSANEKINHSSKENTKAFNEAFGSAASQGLSDFVSGLADVATGQISFGDNLIKAIANFMKQFGEQLIKLGLGKIALDNLFNTGIGGVAAVAAGLALVAVSGAISSSLAKKSQSISSGGTGSGSNTGFSGQTMNAASAQNNIQINGKLVGSGRDLIAVINNTSYDNTQRKSTYG